jgi:hypothetical protein
MRGQFQHVRRNAAIKCDGEGYHFREKGEQSVNKPGDTRLTR